MDFVESLIKSVKKYPLLYDKKNTQYYDRIAKYQAWCAISENCGKSSVECKARWKSLRERYSRELRKINAPPGSAAPSNVAWVHFTRMTFLTETNAPSRSIKLEEATDDETEISVEEDEYSRDTSTTSRQPRRGDVAKLDAVFKTVYESTDNMIPQLKTALQLQFMAMEAQVAQFPEELQDTFLQETFMRIMEIKREIRDNK